jgi:uroporphyrinogen III methyltransferase/synthase
MGTVYLVGAGPGDPKLVTLRALELIQQADVIIYDFLANPQLLAFVKKGAELLYVGKQGSKHELAQQEINALLTRKGKEKEVVVRLKGGDPFIFGRGGEEAEILAEHGIAFEIVPGVTSAIAAPAYAGIPLTHRDYASSVAFITGHEDDRKKATTINWDGIAQGPDTLVFLMGVKNLKKIKERLIKGGRDPETPASVIRWGTTPEQQVVTGPLKEIDAIAKRAGITPPSIIMVGRVVDLRDKLGWFEKRPLFGRKIAVTRAPHQSLRLGGLLSEKGAQVIYVPTIAVTRIEPNRRLAKAIDNIDSYFCIIFTSVNGVSAFFDTLSVRGLDMRALAGIKILPIGHATASLLESKGIIPDLMPKEFTSEGIIEVLGQLDIRDCKFLLPRAEEARDVIVEYVRRKGGSCEVIPVYKTLLPEPPPKLAEKPDIITFTSSSTVNNFVKLFGTRVLGQSLIASIGPVTTKTLEKHGFRAHIEPKRYDIEGLVGAIEEYLAAQQS